MKALKLKPDFSDLLNQTMEALAYEVGANFDGGDGENRLHLEIIFADTLSMTSKEYKAMERDLNKYSVEGKGFTIGAWNDSSGYIYWNKTMEENNYVQVTAYITDLNSVNPIELRAALAEAQSYFEKYALIY